MPKGYALAIPHRHTHFHKRTPASSHPADTILCMSDFDVGREKSVCVFWQSNNFLSLASGHNIFFKNGETDVERKPQRKLKSDSQ
jgi:hypothetical protein